MEQSKQKSVYWIGIVGLFILLLVAVFPANVQMLLNFMRGHNPYTWIAWLRLPVQILLIYWAHQYTRPTVF